MLICKLGCGTLAAAAFQASDRLQPSLDQTQKAPVGLMLLQTRSTVLQNSNAPAARSKGVSDVLPREGGCFGSGSKACGPKP